MTLYALNILDLCFTLYAVNRGAAELNPLLVNPVIMAVYKTGIVGLLCWWLHRRSEPIARYGQKLLTAAYAAVNIWHVMNLIWR